MAEITRFLHPPSASKSGRGTKSASFESLPIASRQLQKASLGPRDELRIRRTLGSVQLLIIRTGESLYAGRIIKAIRKSLRSRIVFRSAYVDKHSLLFQGIDSLSQQLWKDITLQTGRSLWNVFENSSAEDINSRVDQSFRIRIGLLGETSHQSIGSHLDCPVSHLIPGSKHGHACDAARLSMEANQLPEIHFHERITI